VADSTTVFLVLGGVIALLVTNRVPVELVALGTVVALWATDVLSLDQALAGFGDPTVVYIASLFMVSASLDAAGITAWAGQQLVGRVGERRGRLLVLTMLLCASVTALLSANAAVAALVPVVVVFAMGANVAPSRLLLPMAFAAHAGSLLALTGAPKNVIVSEAAKEAGGGYFGFFEFALVGVPLVVGTIVIVLLLGDRLVPERRPPTVTTDLRTHAGTLARHYDLDPAATSLSDRRVGVAEVVIPPRSTLVGATAFPGMVTDDGDLVVLAVHRSGKDVGPGQTVLAPGDALLLRGTWDVLTERVHDLDVLAVHPPTEVRRQAVPFAPGARRTTVIVLAMVALLATGAVPPAIVTVAAAGALVLTKVLPMEQAYASVSWTTVVLVAGMLPLATAMTTSGAADELADALVSTVGDSNAHVLLIVLFVLSALLGQLISNTATVLIVIPVALAAAADLDVSSRPVLMSLNVVTSAAFLTPVATPANLMVLAPGGYRFGDYARLGLPLLAWYFVVAVGVVPLIWRF
jgi:di/tricarboxylate transporter